MIQLIKKIKLFISVHLALSVFLLSLAVSFALFGGTINHPFLFDDAHLENYSYLYTLDNIPKIFGSSYHFAGTSGVYRPMSMVSYVFNRLIFGDSAVGFRIVQILFYSLVGWLLFLVLKKLNFKNWQAILIMLLFLSHPIHNELVNVVVFRHDILMALFVLLAIIVRFSSEKFRASPHLSSLYSASKAATYVLFFIAILSKETAIMAMLMVLYFLIFLDLAPFSILLKGGNEWGRIWRRIRYFKKDLGYSALVILFYFGIRWQVLGKSFAYDPTTIVENPLRHFSFWQSLLTALKVIGLYVAKLIYPATLSIDYSYNQIPAVNSVLNRWVLLGLGSLAISIMVLLPWFKINPRIKIAAAFFLFPLLIVSNLFIKIGAIMAERWLYLSSIGAMILFVLGFEKLWVWLKGSHQKIRIVAIIPLLIIFSLYIFRNLERNFDWQNAFSLYQSTAASSPNSVLARNNLAAMYLEIRDFEKAESELEAADKIYPYYPHLINNWGIFYMRQGKLDKAKEYFLETLKIKSSYLPAIENMAIVLSGEENYKEALEYAKKAYKISPDQNHAATIIYLKQKLNQERN